MQQFYLILLVLFLSSCATKEEEVSVEDSASIEKALYVQEYIKDLDTIPQNVREYTRQLDSSRKFSQEDFEKKYFKAWNLEKSNISLSNAMWAHNLYKVGNTYGENLQLLKQEFFDTTLENGNYEEYGTLNKQAITLKRLNIRAMPTNKPILFDPTQAGEGFPFDYLQNSSIAANKPVFVSHYSKDKKWIFIESSFAFGWVKSASVVIIDKKYTDLWQQAKQIFITKEGIPIYSEDGEFLFKSRIGTMLALVAEDEDSYTVLTISKYKNKKPLYIRSQIDKSIAHRGILKFNSKNINKILKEVSQTNYGWGGIFGQRDCSSTLRDFYTPFGLWLPRNSYQQSKSGHVISLKGLSDVDKLSLIKKEAEPFQTLLYKKGHIVLYVGTYKGRVVIYQNVWGVKTKKEGKEGRFIIGRPIFSTLEVGKNLKYFDKDSSLLHNLKSMTTL